MMVFNSNYILVSIFLNTCHRQRKVTTAPIWLARGSLSKLLLCWILESLQIKWDYWCQLEDKKPHELKFQEKNFPLIASFYLFQKL